MKTIKLITVLIGILFMHQSFAQDLIKLPEPNKTGGKPLMQALNERQSSRDFIDKELSMQQISDLLWAAYGINRNDLGKHTVPTSRNIQDMEVYIATKDGAFLYMPKEHSIQKVVSTDIREKTGKQDFVKVAAVNLIYVSDFSKAGNGSDEIKTMTAATHCGFIGQNVYLYCASEGLISVFRAYIDNAEIAKTLNLPDNKHVIYCQTVGYSN
ncbi:MAG: nitroreductase family protein [Bacteroidales bacterium]|jgi:nitroreductase|nr:nitroreductase family protein [Bacteroidales bacterium]